MLQISPCRRRSQGGFSLIMIGACAVVLFGMMGLTTDLGRVYIAKNELQAFADASAMAAALKLNGTSSGSHKRGFGSGHRASRTEWYY